MIDFAVGLRDLRAGDDERIPDAGLVGRPLACDPLNGSLTAEPSEPLSPTITITVLAAFGSYCNRPSSPRRASPVSTSRRPNSESMASVIWSWMRRPVSEPLQSQPSATALPLAGTKPRGGCCQGVWAAL